MRSDISTIQRYYQLIPQSIRNPTRAFQRAGFEDASAASILNRLRNLSREQLVSGAVISAELVGFFTVGKMIGRAKLVGYRGDPHLNGH